LDRTHQRDQYTFEGLLDAVGGHCSVNPDDKLQILINEHLGGTSESPSTAVSPSGTTSTATAGSAPEAQQNGGIGAAIAAELAEISQAGNVVGASSAPITLQFFADLECPVCKEFALRALPTIVKQWVRPGKLKIEFHSLETATREPELFNTQQVAALAAGKQQLMWNYVELFYREQGEEGSGYVTDSFLQGLAKQVPALNLAQWAADRNDGALSAQVAADAELSKRAGLTGTPSFLIGRSGAPLKRLEYTSLSDPTTFNQAIERLLRA